MNRKGKRIFGKVFIAQVKVLRPVLQKTQKNLEKALRSPSMLVNVV